MNHLNSILLEGVVTTVRAAEKRAVMTLESSRYGKTREGALTVKKTAVQCVVEGGLADAIARQPTPFGVRVVGRLDMEEGQLVVNTEHIEFKVVSANAA